MSVYAFYLRKSGVLSGDAVSLLVGYSIAIAYLNIGYWCKSLFELPSFRPESKHVLSFDNIKLVHCLNIYSSKNIRNSTYIFLLFNTESLIFKIENIF